MKKYQKMIFAYLQGRVNLKRVFLLIDSRHGIKKVDSEIMEMLDKANTEKMEAYNKFLFSEFNSLFEIAFLLISYVILHILFSSNNSNKEFNVVDYFF